ncbi:hypothetical protein HanRHA438_Chr07g0311281 [Helianthus annuus]|nr:hypothetical protein HanIR_Chr07g0324921 [Helianthus annuus]KAJ0908515.1 hypothetical protein HanRHA438_Chr07g0311281 [Helianthus annuus]
MALVVTSVGSHKQLAVRPISCFPTTHPSPWESSILRNLIHDNPFILFLMPNITQHAKIIVLLNPKLGM